MAAQRGVPFASGSIGASLRAADTGLKCVATDSDVALRRGGDLQYWLILNVAGNVKVLFCAFNYTKPAIYGLPKISENHKNKRRIRGGTRCGL